jgi:hypothetical protein
MGIRADRGAHREEDEENGECVARELLERRSVIPRGNGLQYILNGVSFNDGPNQWELCRSSTVTGGTSQGADSSGSTASLALTDTCATGGHHSQI